MGDMVMLTPALGLLRKAYPEAVFDLVTGGEGKALAPFMPIRFERVLLYDRKSLLQHRHGMRLRKEIGEAGYDLGFCFETSVSYRRLFDPSRLRVVFPGEAGGHSCETSLAMVAKETGIEAEVADGGRFPETLWIEAERTRETEALFLSKGVDPDTLVMALHPSFSGLGKPHKYFKRAKHKKWKAENYGVLARRLGKFLDEKGIRHRIVMNLLPDEKSLGERIVEISENRAEWFDLPKGLGNYLGYLQRADLLIAPDTGPMHAAVALGTPAIALFSGEKPERCGPWSDPESFAVIRAERLSGGRSGIRFIQPENVVEVFASKMDSFVSLSRARRKRSKPVFHLS